MEAIALLFTKFSEELVAAQLAALCLASAVAVYWLLLRKKKKESAEWVPAAVVRAYLDRVRADEREVRLKLFGEDSAPVATGASVTAALGGAPDPSLLREIDALRAQLSASDQRSSEFDRLLAGLKAEKAALEQKLKDAPAAAAAGGGDTAAVNKELADLRARLQEYEVIEDDLANLKKFQKENETLKQRIESLEKAGPALTIVPAAPAPEPEPVTVIAGEGIAAAPEPTPAPAPAAEPAPETNTNVLQAVQPAADAAAAPVAEKSAKQKEEELLSEFEKMLAS